MASFATTTPLPRRKKQTVYGKSSRSACSPANAGFFEDDDNTSTLVERGPRKHYTPGPVRKVKPASPPPVQKPASPAKKPGALSKPKRSPPRAKDPFDIPSDDEQGADDFSQAPLPLLPRQRISSRLVEEQKEETEQLAPWERKAAAVAAKKGGLQSTTATKSTRSRLVAKTVEEKQGKVKADGHGMEEAAPNGSQQSEWDTPEPVPMTAKERLAARRQNSQTNNNISSNGPDNTTKGLPKRSAVKANVDETSQSKRRRVTPQPESPPKNKVGADSAVINDGTSKESPTASVDIFDVPSDGHTTQPTKPIAKKVPQSRYRSNRPGILRKVTPQKGLSAPSRLQDMLPKEDEFAFTTVESNPPSTPATPPTAIKDAERAMSTPQSNRSSDSHVHKTGRLTPKQNQLWADLFEPDAVPNTVMKKLSIAEDSVKNVGARNAPAMLQRSSSDIPVTRTRIVDRLKASAANSSEDESDESQDEDMTEDQPILPPSQIDAVMKDPPAGRESDQASQTNESQVSQTKAVASGSLITYAKQRSHLADDNIESALMLDIPMDVPERPSAAARRVGKAVPAMKPNAHNQEELEEGTTSGLRTIHELRAGGRNTRMMGEIEDLLGEIADHATSARSRRRRALLELATKLLDKSFAEQIVSYGYENAIIAECKTSSDAPADFLLATSLLLLLHSEPPSHTIENFRETIPFLGRLLAETTMISKLVKERRSNMSRSAQADIVALAEKVKVFEPVWSIGQPPIISSRTIALKALDYTVGKLRKLGNTSELLDLETLTLLIPKSGFTGLEDDASKAFEANLIISIMEALKTLSAASDWPDSCITAISTLPAVFAETWRAPPHTKWLAYRLCANITNDASIERSAFTDNDAVRHLMADVVSGFAILHDASNTAESTAELTLDLLVLAIGTLINLTEHSTLAQHQSIHPATLPSLHAIVHIFQQGQHRALEAESVEESAANVAYGYLAILLANICQDADARRVVRALLPGQKMDLLVDAVGEFVAHHQRVDGLEGEGVEGVVGEGGDGGAVWSSFTERLLGVLVKLKDGEGAV
ncbi:hypothetical protein Q7P37_005272 [Cladosporium fusiforme]